MQRLVGYLDRLHARPGERLPLRVSSPVPWTATLVRLWHEAEDAVPSPLDGTAFPAAEHPITLGSHLAVDGDALPDPVTFAAWVFRTGTGGLFTGGGLTVAIDTDGRLRASSGDTSVTVVIALPLREWRLVVVTRDSALTATHVPAPGARVPVASASTWPVAKPAHDEDPWRLGDRLDGKLDRPALFAAALHPDEALAALAGPGPAAGDALHAAWDLAYDPAGVSIHDAGTHGLHGELVGMPTRAVTSHDWTGEEDAWRHRPHEWSAVHFHADDLEDARWPAAADLALPDDLPSGAYAVRLDGEDGSTDHVPVLVAPRTPQARVAVVLPTFTYRAYANERISPDFDVVSRGPADDRVSAEHLLSQYNRHGDGSGVVHASTRRPLLSVRPDHVYWLTGQPHGLSADLHLLTWLRDEGIEHDVLTDELVDDETLRAYRVVVTGSHHEYVTRDQLQALRAYRDAGGRLMVLGGNSLQLVVGVHRDRPWVTEVRRGESHVGLWQGDPGETHLACTGEPGGHWNLRRERSRELSGLDLSGMGFTGARPYERTARSREPDVAWVFDGVPDGPIGTHGLVMGGAAGYEVDSYDVRAGSPADAIVLATARGFGDSYVAAGPDPDVRADLVLVPAPNDGWVFATGSIAWCGALPATAGDPSVARITGNVLRRFLD